VTTAYDVAAALATYRTGFVIGKHKSPDVVHKNVTIATPPDIWWSSKQWFIIIIIIIIIIMESH